jgi:hypothetical protein
VSFGFWAGDRQVKASYYSYTARGHSIAFIAPQEAFWTERRCFLSQFARGRPPAALLAFLEAPDQAGAGAAAQDRDLESAWCA